MKKTAKPLVRVLSLMLAFVMLAAAGVTVASAAVEGVTYVDAYTSKSAQTNSPFDDENDVTANRISIQGSFRSFSVATATYGTRPDVCFRARVFKWNKTYNKTLEGTPIYDQRFEKTTDNRWVELDLGQVYEAGEYLLVFSDATGTLNMDTTGDGKDDTFGYFTVYTRNNNRGAQSCAYINGVEFQYDLQMKVGFVGEVPSEPFKAVINFQDVTPDNSAGTRDYWDIGDRTKEVGQRVKTTAALDGFALITPTWGNSNCDVEVSAYVWDETFEKTVANGAFASVVLDNIRDNNSSWITFEDPIPAGEYLFTVKQLSGTRVGIYHFTTNASGGLAYIDGAEVRNDLFFIARFSEKLPAGQQPFLPCESEADRSTGEVTLPEPWQPAEDSLLNTHKVQPSTWVFTDGLGRESWEYGENGVGAYNSEKIIAMFYWDWHLRASESSSAFNIQNFIEKYPEAKNDVSHAGWNDAQQYYWNESIFGYYSSTDSWVLRRHAELLANGSVDTVFMDDSNVVITFRNGYTAVYEEWTKAQNLGVNVPKVSYHLPMWYAAGGNPDEQWWTTEHVEYLYMDIYRRGQYQNMWFWFDGKPMLMANNEHFIDAPDPMFQEMLSFFTYRAGVSSYKDGEDRTPQERLGSWDWLGKYPQATYYASRADINKNKVEEMSVGIAVNFSFETNKMTAMNGPTTMGRSYSSDNPTRYNDSQKNEKSDTSKYGYFFSEQWEYAISVDPKVVFVTGWNEWTVSRRSSWVGVNNAFGDQFNDEFSRDIEPTKGALKDYYYYQFINYSRKFKGAEEMPVPSAKTTIDLSAGQEQWAAVEPYFAAYIGNTMNRESYGRVGSKKYVDFSARNDVIGAQIARDDEFVYFNVECNDNITPYTDKLWMNLYIDVDQQNQGWETFDYVVNKTAASEKTSVLEKFTDGYASEKVADVEYTVDGKYMTIKIAKSDLGISGDDFTINFAWTDNVHDSDDLGAYTKDGWIYSQFSGDIMEFYLSGEVAPGARFKFSYISTAENATIPPVGGGDEDTSADETTADTEADTTVADTTVADVTTDGATEGDTTAAVADGGCKSSVAMSVIALLTAIGAAVVLKKRD